MPYCVRCGVKLQDNADSCPLCGTPVWNPEAENTGAEEGSKETPQNAPTSFGERRGEQLKQTIRYNRSLFVGVMTFFFIVSFLVTLLIDITIHQEITWSFYSTLSITALWVLLIFPILYRGTSRLTVLMYQAIIISIYLLLFDNHQGGVSWSWYPSLSLIALTLLMLVFRLKRFLPLILEFFLAYADIALFLFFMDLLTSSSWFLTLALPLTTLVMVGGYLLVALVNVKRKKDPMKAVWFGIIFGLFLAAIITVAVDLLVSLHAGSGPLFSWSYITVASLLPLIAFSIVVYVRKPLQYFMQKKFHL
ncbi:MAG: DUF6320 domain-containing protein [Spirochaetota bacterium]